MGNVARGSVLSCFVLEVEVINYILHPHVEGYWPQYCLDNIAKYLSWLLDVPVHHEEQKEGVPLVLGAHYWKYVPKNAVIFNTEQLNASGTMVDEWYINQIRWRSEKYLDYDCRHNRWPAKFIKIPVGHCPVWQEDFDRWKNVQKDTDVLCYGSTNPRRLYVMQYLKNRGIKVRSLTNAFGESLVEQICRAKCVLHVHYYPDGYHAPFRTIYAAHAVPVISEMDAMVPEDMLQFDYGNLDALVHMIKSGVPMYTPKPVDKSMLDIYA